MFAYLVGPQNFPDLQGVRESRNFPSFSDTKQFFKKIDGKAEKKEIGQDFCDMWRVF